MFLFFIQTDTEILELQVTPSNLQAIPVTPSSAFSCMQISTSKGIETYDIKSINNLINIKVLQNYLLQNYHLFISFNF